ncbi:MAG: hypothetical protein AAF549_05035 [Pseudomonadota bacterium]
MILSNKNDSSPHIVSGENYTKNKSYWLNQDTSHLISLYDSIDQNRIAFYKSNAPLRSDRQLIENRLKKSALSIILAKESAGFYRQLKSFETAFIQANTKTLKRLAGRNSIIPAERFSAIPANERYSLELMNIIARPDGYSAFYTCTENNENLIVIDFNSSYQPQNIMMSNLKV